MGAHTIEGEVTFRLFSEVEEPYSVNVRVIGEIFAAE
jgi:hypothetical protein